VGYIKRFDAQIFSGFFPFLFLMMLSSMEVKPSVRANLFQLTNPCPEVACGDWLVQLDW